MQNDHNTDARQATNTAISSLTDTDISYLMRQNKLHTPKLISSCVELQLIQGEITSEQRSQMSQVHFN